MPTVPVGTVPTVTPVCEIVIVQVTVMVWGGLPESVTVTLYVKDPVAVGVPVILPCGSMDRPGGSVPPNSENL
jgi:hypothetical protein